MAANVSTDHGAETTRPAAGPSTLRRVTVVVGLILLPLGAVILAAAPPLHASGWAGAALVVGGAAVLTVGIGLVAAPVHAEHLRARRGADVGQDRSHGGRA
jgi:hypothetical protein